MREFATSAAELQRLLQELEVQGYWPMSGGLKINPDCDHHFQHGGVRYKFGEQLPASGAYRPVSKTPSESRVKTGS